MQSSVRHALGKAYQAQLQELELSRNPLHIRIALLEAFREHLRRVVVELKDLHPLHLTSRQCSSMLKRDKDSETEGLIQKILEKQRIKMELAQELDSAEDDLMEVERIVVNQRLYAEQLDQRIDLKLDSLKPPKLNKIVKSGSARFLRLFA